jgi:hypothetical protein
MADDAKKPWFGEGTGQEVFLALLWLGTSMYTAHVQITGDQGVSGALASAAAALPGLVAATVLAGATLGAAASSRYNSAGGRLLAGLVIGGLFGFVAAAGIRYGYGNESSITVLAVVVGIASVAGGAAAVLPGQVLDAGLWAATWVFFAGVIFGVLEPNVLNILGGGASADASAQEAASTRFFYATAALTGLIAGYYALNRLRDRTALAWFVIAGALPGLTLLAAEVLTRFGGHSVVDFVTGFAADDAALVPLSDTERLLHALIVLGVGSVVALLLAIRQEANRVKEEKAERLREARELAED